MKGFDAYDEESTRAALTEAFSPFGEVREIILPFDRERQQLKGFGYVVFTEANGANVRRGHGLGVEGVASSQAGLISRCPPPRR